MSSQQESPTFEEMMDECKKMWKRLEEVESELAVQSDRVSELRKSLNLNLEKVKSDGVDLNSFQKIHFYECKKCRVLTENESEICMECM